MTTQTDERVIDELAAHQALGELCKIERSLAAYKQIIADSCGVRDIDKHIDSLRGTVKQYLIESGDREIHDGEFDETFHLQTDYASPSYDLVTASQTDTGPADLAEAARAGMLTLHNKSLEVFRGAAGAAWAERLWRYRQPGGVRAVKLMRGPGK